VNRDEPIFRLPPLRVEHTLAALAETVDWGLSLLGVPEAWRISRGDGVTVAVLDTGIDEDHPDFGEAVVAARDFTGSRHGPIDRHGHGTHVAGTIAARQNDVGVIGVAPQCRLLVAKVLSDDGAGSTDSVARGVDWAVEQGADVLSLSLGSPRASRPIELAIERAVSAGRLVICAAGNDGRQAGVNFPGRLASTVAVAAVDRHGRVAAFSSRGPEVDIAAPGEDVLSTFLDGGYARLSGTSMATPFVAGVAALVLAKHRRAGGATPVGSQRELLEHLRRTATDAGPRGHDPAYGWGIVNPASLLAANEASDAARFEIGPIEVNGVPGRLVFVAN
jgi:subtilisin family serine protease